MHRRTPDLSGAPRQHHLGVLRLSVVVFVLPPGLPVATMNRLLEDG